MAAALLNILPKRLFDFTNVTASTTQTYTIAERIDISQFIDAVIILRVHTCTATAGSITFSLFGDGYTFEDPAIKFATSAALVSTILSTTTATGFLQTQGITGTLLGRFALFRISGFRTSGTLNAVVSADLLLRSPNDSGPMGRS